MRDAVEIDVAVFGGGIAGLWLLRRLRALGFDAALFEKNSLGTGQTIASVCGRLRPSKVYFTPL